MQCTLLIIYDWWRKIQGICNSILETLLAGSSWHELNIFHVFFTTTESDACSLFFGSFHLSMLESSPIDLSAGPYPITCNCTGPLYSWFMQSLFGQSFDCLLLKRSPLHSHKITEAVLDTVHAVKRKRNDFLIGRKALRRCAIFHPAKKFLNYPEMAGL